MKPMIIKNRYHQRVIHKLAHTESRISVTFEQLTSRVLQMFPEYRPSPLLQLSDVTEDIRLITDIDFYLLKAVKETKVYKSEYYAKNKEKLKAQNRAYQRKNKDILSAKQRERYLAKKKLVSKLKEDRVDDILD